MSKKIGLEAVTTRRSFTRRSTLKGGLALGAGLGAGVFGIIGKASAEPIAMRFGSDSPMNSPHTQSAVKMKEMVEKGTSGRVQVTIFPDGQLGGSRAMMDGIKSGTLDGLVTAVSIIAPAVPEMDVFNLPFLYRDAVQTLQVANGPFGKKLIPKMNAAFNCEVLGYSTDGIAEAYTKKHPIRTPKDMAGLKFAVSSSRIQRDTVLAFDAIPTVLDIDANYTSLQTGLVDSTIKTRPDVIQLKIYQVVKYMCLAGFYCMPNMLFVSSKFMGKLTKADQDVVREAGPPSCDAQFQAVLAAQKDALGFLTGHGIETAEVENLQAFRDKVSGVYKDASDRVGAALVNEARSLAES
jgi:TRAP-type C4-dicarboxylate transport system substrate-binding protein